MARKKTLEELRAGARARSKRWRDKNKATHRERVLELYGRAKAQGFFVGGVRPEELVRLEQAMKKGGQMDRPVTDNVTHRGEIEGYDTPTQRNQQTGWTDDEGRRGSRSPQGTQGVARSAPCIEKGNHPDQRGDIADRGGDMEPHELDGDAGMAGESEGMVASRGMRKLSAHEKAVKRLAQLQGRQAAGRLNAVAGPGVEIEVEVAP
jgi:hypothetical protein